MLTKVSLIFKNLRSEWQKIIFPTQEQILKDSVVVLITSVILGLIIFALDAIIGSGFGYIFSIFGK